jgi:hypothetical protein
MSIQRLFVVGVIVTGAVAMSGCSGKASNATPGCPDGHNHAAHVPASDANLVRVVNRWCPVAGEDPVGNEMVADAELTRTFRGQTVGFCCPNCLPVWDKMNDEQRDAALKAAVAKQGS